jgi:hypothetical protein
MLMVEAAGVESASMIFGITEKESLNKQLQQHSPTFYLVKVH